MKAIQCLAAQDLAGQSGIWLEVIDFIQFVRLFLCRRDESVKPLVFNIDMACGTGTGPATLSPDRDTPVPDHFHDAPAIKRFKCMSLAFAVCDENLQQMRASVDAKFLLKA